MEKKSRNQVKGQARMDASAQESLFTDNRISEMISGSPSKGTKSATESFDDEVKSWEDEKHTDLESSRYEYIKSKTVSDSDGFDTDYTMYKDNITGNYVFVFGDSDLYTPEDGDFDYIAETEEEALAWFDGYTGLDDEEDFGESEYLESGNDIRTGEIFDGYYKKGPAEEEVTKDERESEDKQPKEAVACESGEKLSDEEWLKRFNSILPEDVEKRSNWPDEKIKEYFGDDAFWSGADSAGELLLGDNGWDGAVRRNGRVIGRWSEVDGKYTIIPEKK